MNNLTIVGRVVKDAELTYIKNTDGLAKLSFTVAVERAYQKDKNNKKSDFIPCEILGKRAEALSPYVEKGKMVAIQGELHIENVKKNDEWKTYISLSVNTFEFLGGSKKEESKNEKPGSFQAIDYDPFDDVPF